MKTFEPVLSRFRLLLLPARLIWEWFAKLDFVSLPTELRVNAGMIQLIVQPATMMHHG